jgi:N-methylhydantoinase B/oxoprolinase/acetone carboxylase alpha subunit
MPTDLTRPDPIRLKIFKNLYQFIAEQMGIVLQPTFRSLSELMGIVLQNTATSVNIKERLDFSCAVFDRDGYLVANAPHIPVHLTWLMVL